MRSLIVLIILFVLILLLNGCVTALTSRENPATTSDQAHSFALGLKKLEKSGDTTPLKKLASGSSGTIWSEYSQSVLNIYSVQQQQLKNLRQKNEKLQNDLESLNQINLELEKRTN